MYKVKIYLVGKTKESWLQEALSEYEKRLLGTLQVEWICCKSTSQLESLLEKESHFLCLDPQGKEYTSPSFSTSLIQWFSRFHSRLCVVIGGPEGLPQQVRAKAFSLISLSKMTLTHQMTRLVLMEQIYRALEIERGSAYHK